MTKTPEELSLHEALTEGMHAGLMGRSWAENPWQSARPEHAKWEEGRKMAETCQRAGEVC